MSLAMDAMSASTETTLVMQRATAEGKGHWTIFWQDFKINRIKFPINDFLNHALLRVVSASPNPMGLQRSQMQVSTWKYLSICPLLLVPIHSVGRAVVCRYLFRLSCRKVSLKSSGWHQCELGSPLSLQLRSVTPYKNIILYEKSINMRDLFLYYDSWGCLVPSSLHKPNGK